jgi:hypothetical protein
MKIVWNKFAEYTKPVPAKKILPEWYKSMPPFHGGHTPKESFIVTETSDGQKETFHVKADPTVKLCVPYLDMLTMGYVQPLPYDIEVKRNGEVLCKNYPEMINIGYRKYDQNQPLIPDTFIQQEFIFTTGWEPKTPRGWSTIYTHPFNRHDLPFLSVSGIIDTDRWHTTGGIPFYIKKNFVGIIKSGTPFYQMIPFERQNWESDWKQEYVEGVSQLNFEEAHGGYKKHYWKRKVFS